MQNPLHKIMRDPNRDAVKERLERLGFEVHVIPEDSISLRPDLRAIADEVTMYVEVKTRSEDRTLRDQMEAARVGDKVEILTDLDKHNTISSEVRQASRQLSSVARETDLRLLWYRADRGLFVSNTKEQIGSTLFGMRMVLADHPPHARRPWHCAYAGHSDFVRFRDIDGVMVEVNGWITLFLNPFSPRSDAFSCSRIARLMKSDNAVFDIEREIAGGRVFAAGNDAPRRDDVALLAHIASKYPGTVFISFLRSVGVTMVETIDATNEDDDIPQ